MKQTKYRAWSNKWDKMVYPYDTEFRISIDPAGQVHTIWKDLCDEEGVWLMEDTGYFDSEGKLIYDADIFAPDGDDYFGLVEWFDNKWVVNWGNDSRDPLTDYHVDAFTVVGNLFENTNLIRK